MTTVAHEPRMTGTKHCPKCNTDKPVLAFCVNKRSADGLNGWCRSCAAEAHKLSPSRRAIDSEIARKKSCRADFILHSGINTK